MYEICDREPEAMAELVRRSCEIKRRIVEKDPEEKGERALLNLGHTLGHAIEKAKGFSLTHGECVALGCVAAAFISWKKELLPMEEYYEIRDRFVPFNLPISVDELDPQHILSLTKSDKKMDGGSVRFILLQKIGKAVIDRSVTDEQIWRPSMKSILRKRMHMNNRKWGLDLLFILAGVLLDQWTKSLAVLYLKGQEAFVLIPGVLELRYLENRGAAFGILQGGKTIFLIITPIVLLAAAYVLIRMPDGGKYRILHILLDSIIIGAVGNMIDRIRLDYVVDFMLLSV